jgi:hypothetical protein
MDTFILCAENSAMSLDSGAYEFTFLSNHMYWPWSTSQEIQGWCGRGWLNSNSGMA